MADIDPIGTIVENYEAEIKLLQDALREAIETIHATAAMHVDTEKLEAVLKKSE